MKYIKFFVVFLPIVMINFVFAGPPVDYLPLTRSKLTKWEADSVFLGAAPTVIAGDNQVNIKWKGTYSSGLGKLFLVLPNYSDSLKFLFHNKIDSFPQEVKEINLGTFPAGTELIFMYMVTDTSWKYKPFNGKPNYSGAGTNGKYVSEVKNVLGNIRAVAGKIDSTKVEIGFEDDIETFFNAIIFEVSGVTLKRN